MNKELFVSHTCQQEVRSVSPASHSTSKSFKKCCPHCEIITEIRSGHYKRRHVIEKDEKYFERRKKNNLAAKKSRDAKKYREDQIALKAFLWAEEVQLLKAQIQNLIQENKMLFLTLHSIMTSSKI